MSGYNSYRPTGSASVPCIPAHWGLKRVKHVATLSYGDALASEIRVEGEICVFGSNGPVGTHIHANTGAPVIVVGRKGSYGKLNFSEVPVFCIDTAYHIAQEACEADLRFMYYALQVLGLDTLSQDTGVPGLSRDIAYRQHIALPPADEQIAIASYLDSETARVDGLISDKKALVKTLKEMRRSSVAEAITKGIRRERNVRESDLSWVRQIPSDWRSISLKRLVRLSGGHTPSTGNSAYWDGAIPWFSPKDMKADELFDSIDHVTEQAVHESGLQVIEPGTTMIVVRGMILAHTFPVCVTQVSATINQDMKALVPDDDVDPRYLPWLLRGASALFLSLTEQSAHGTMALRTDRFMSERLPIPPLDEQLEIVEHLEAERRRIDALVEQVNQELDLLDELRSATITDAVLGRIDVRDHTKN